MLRLRFVTLCTNGPKSKGSTRTGQEQLCTPATVLSHGFLYLTVRPERRGVAPESTAMTNVGSTTGDFQDGTLQSPRVSARATT
jgi:hypothetical protein